MAGNTSLLSTKEHEICENMSSQRTLEGKRAKALLALYDGDIQVVAAKKSGLSYGQVKYLLTVFRKNGLTIFPETTITEKEPTIMKKAKSKKSKPKNKKKEKTKEKKKNVKKAKEKIKSKKNKQKKSNKKKSKKSKKK